MAAGPLYRTESLRAIIGAEALRGHWLYPVLHGEPFLTKPPGQYAAIGLASLPLGRVTDVTARLPSVAAATLAVFLMAGVFRRVLGDRAALLAGLLIPCSILWLDKAPSAEIDMTLVGWVTAALVLFHRGLEAPRASSGWLAASLLCVAAGTLTKWTAPAFFALTALPLLAWQRRLRLLVGWPLLLAVGVAVTVVAGWAALVTQHVGWDALADTVRKEAAYRFAPKSAAKGYPWTEVVTYPLLVWAAHLPLSLFALRTFHRGFAARWDDSGGLLLAFFHCWAWPNLLFWALVPNHNVRYALPVSPALMGLGVMGLIDWWRSRRPEAVGCVVHQGRVPVASDRLRRWLAPSPRVLRRDPLPRGGEGKIPAGFLHGSAGGNAPVEGSAVSHPLPPGGEGRGEARGVRGPATDDGNPAIAPDVPGGEGEPGCNATRPPPLPDRDRAPHPTPSSLPERHAPGRRSAVPYLAAFLALWLVAKVVFVEVVIPRRTAGRDAEATAALLRDLVPNGEPLYLLKLKDEGVLFYYGRPTRKLPSPAELPRPAHVVLVEAEWDAREAIGGVELVRWMYDQQGDPLILARVTHR